MVTFSQVLTVNFFWDTNIIYKRRVASSSLSKKVNSTQFFADEPSALLHSPGSMFCWAFVSVTCMVGSKIGSRVDNFEKYVVHHHILSCCQFMPFSSVCPAESAAGQWPFYLGNLKGSFNACRTRGGTSPCWWRCDKERYQGIPSIWSKFALATGTCCHWHSRTPRSREMGEFLCAIDPFILSPNLGLLVSTTVMSVVSTTYSQCNWN